jgi:NADH-quinone oxidoreductase subunit N
MNNDLFQLSPVLLAASTGLLVLLIDLFRRPGQGSSTHLVWLTAGGLSAACGVVWKLWPGNAEGITSTFLAGTFVVDEFTLFVWGLMLVATIAVALYSSGFDAENNLDHGEYYSFLSFAVVGMMLMVAAANLLVLFLALETLSLALYALVGMKRSSARSAEAALKYFLNGGLASALLLYGIVLLWGETGTLELAALGQALLAETGGPLLYIGGSLLLLGFAFKIAAVPFHMWTPDAYHGAPTTVGGFMAGAVKVAAFAALMRVVYQGMLPEIFAKSPFSYADAVILISVLSMTVGNLLAMHQQNVKRMLAYSSISHAGYLLMGLLLVPPLGSGNLGLRFASGSVLFYLVAYGFSTLLAFGVLSRLAQGGSEDVSLTRLAGLSRRRPLLALCLTVALVSLAGFPPTAGFFAKFALLRDLMVLGNGKLVVLVVIAVINALFSVYYYLRPVMHMYMHEEEQEKENLHIPGITAKLALVVLAIFILFLGLFPGRLVALANSAAKSLTYQHAPNLRSKGPARLAPFAHEDAKGQ